MIAVGFLGLFHFAIACQAESNHFAIHVVDEATGRGVPLAQLRTVNGVSYWTDSAGYAAIDEPSLIGSEAFFHVSSHGYEYPADGFGFRGVRLTVAPGEEATVKLRRINIAERLYRVTGEGIYRDSVMLSKPVPIAQPLLSAGVVGSDSVLTAVYKNKLHWFWGDTNFANYPLGNFHVPGATSSLPRDGGLAADIGVDLTYYADASDLAKATCKMPGDGPTWIFGLTVLGDDSESQSMYAGYAKIRPPLDVYERGIVQWDDAKEQFVKRNVFPTGQQGYPMGHPVITDRDGARYIHYCDPLPMVRVAATTQAIIDGEAYEVYTYLADGSRPNKLIIDRDASGKLNWKWRRDSMRVTRELEEQLERAGKIYGNEGAYRMRTAGSDRRWTLHTASIAWNEHRSRWIMIGLEVGGESSHLGEVYYAEADDLMGPWSPATKIVSHDGYSFYNPRLHPMLTSDDGRSIYFEGTYTKSFSGTSVATPRYDYNQIMYCLDLSDPWLSD